MSHEHFLDLKQPEVAARRVHEHFNTKRSPMSLEQARELAAQILGYVSWDALVSWIGQGENTQWLPDEDLDPLEQEFRLLDQAVRLTNLNGELRFHNEQLVQQLRLTAEDPQSDLLLYTPWTTNQVSHTGSDPGEKYQNLGSEGWRFRPSLRSERILENLRDRGRAFFYDGSITLDAYVRYLKGVIQRQPENIFALSQLIDLMADQTAGDPPEPKLVYKLRAALSDVTAFGIRTEELESYDTVFVAGPMNTFDGYNRDFKEAVYTLGTALYVIKDYESAYHWLQTSLRINDCHPHHREFEYLGDICGRHTQGDVHEKEWGQSYT